VIHHRDGRAVRAEIDAAGPEVARLTNDLLEATYGPRFSVAFETLRETKSKAGEYSEVFDVRVYDGGAERQVEQLSGGEKVVVGEAVGLAISIFNARKSGVRWQTIFRDETAGALDPENAARYVAMLRRALSLGGFTQCVFIAHLPAVYESADVQLRVEDGRVEWSSLSEAA
jgi:exonuclease SbcC